MAHFHSTAPKTSTFIRKGLPIVCSVPAEVKPICGVPEGKMRLRLRPAAVALLFVRSRDGIRKFLLEDKGDTWFARADLSMGRNVRRPRTVAWLPGADVKRCLRLNPSQLLVRTA